eukprot:jgi/Orpsp1_1/1179801/evm.model.c7180000070792.1
MKCYMIYFIGFFLIFVNGIFTKSIYKPNKDDKYYLIYVNNTFGEYQVFTNSNVQKREESQIFIESLVNDIHELILDNRDTYKNPEKLDEIEEAANLRKRKRNLENQDNQDNQDNQEIYSYDESSFVYPISSVKDRVVLYAYLSNYLSKKLPNMNDNIIEVVQNRAITHFDHSNYNVDDILSQTGWENLSVRSNADFHLSLISQGIYNKSLVNQYDNNYYYPSTAGKDIDIVIFDSSFGFGYSEFDTSNNDRIVKCVGSILNGKAMAPDSEKKCGETFLDHGETVSDVAAGAIHGVASRANVYGISVPVSAVQGINDSDVLGGIQYIYENMIRSHKTVVNLSLGCFEKSSSEFFAQYSEVIDGIRERGGIIVSSAGNDGIDITDGRVADESKDITNEKEYYIPCDFEEVICVGGIENEKKSNMDTVYKIAKESNYGRNVDVYSPFHVNAEVPKKRRIAKVNKRGTSFSTPIVSGIIATIMGEDLNIDYTKEIIMEKLLEYSQSENIETENNEPALLVNNGKLIVYSEDGKYNGCGIHAGNLPCNTGIISNTNEEQEVTNVTE